MEYLMTYGWAILIVAVVLGALYSLGVFGGSNFLGGTCVAAPGYLCSAPLLATDGTLSFTYGYQGPNVTIVGFACTETTTAPSSFAASGSSTLEPGQQESVSVSCPVSASTLGTSFSGYLWVEYSQAGKSNLIDKFATITTTITTASAACSGTVEAYVPIQITNGASFATQTTFQQELSFVTGSYSAYTTAGLNNACFSTGPNGGGTALQAWLERDPIMPVPDIVWVKLISSIPAGGSQTIYMNFMAANDMSTTGPMGEAPQLSPTYGEYDNGKQVFNFYDNFTGTNLNNNLWTAVYTGSQGNVLVNDGLTLTSGTSSWSGGGVVSTSEYNPAIDVADVYVSGGVSGNGDFAFDWINPAPTNACSTWNGLDCSVVGGTTYGYAITYRTWVGNWGLQGYGPSGGDNQNEAGCGGATGSTSLEWNLTLTYNEIGLQGYADCLYGPSTVAAPMANSYMFIVAQSGGTATTASFYWARIRTMPPDDTMPTVTLGNVVAG